MNVWNVIGTIVVVVFIIVMIFGVIILPTRQIASAHEVCETNGYDGYVETVRTLSSGFFCKGKSIVKCYKAQSDGTAEMVDIISEWRIC